MTAAEGPELNGKRHSDATREHRRRRHGKSKISANMTPMIDIVFNLLIFFLLGSSFKVQEGMLPSRLPVDDSNQTEAVESLLRPITIRLIQIGDSTDPGDCDIVVENYKGRPKDFHELYEVLEKIKDRNAAYSVDSPVRLLPEKNVQMGHVINAYNAAVRAKFKAINWGSG